MAKVTFEFEDLEDGTVNFRTESDPVPDLTLGLEALTNAQQAALITAMFVQKEVFGNQGSGERGPIDAELVEETKESGDE